MGASIATGRGVFITLEGPDGAGKSSQAKLLAEVLAARGVDAVLTREPGGTPLGERIRGLLLESDRRAGDPVADSLLFNAARRRLVSDVVVPALERGSVVVCDRYSDSTLAYQGYGAGVPLPLLRAVADIATGGLRPDRTVLLDVPPRHGLARRAGGPAGDLTRFEVDEEHGLDFHERVRAGYLALAAEDPERWRVVDGTGDPATVARAVVVALADVLPLGGGGAR